MSKKHKKNNRDIKDIKVNNFVGSEEVKPEVVLRRDVLKEEIDLQRSKKKKRNKKIKFAVVVILLIIIVIVSINAMGMFVRKQSEIEMPLVYTTNGELKFVSSRKKTSVSVGNYNKDKMGIIRYPNRSDKYFMFTQDGELYLTYVRSNKETIKIADKVLSYFFSANDKNISYIDVDGNLYVYNFKSSEKLDTDVSLIIDVTEDRVYYEKDGGLFSKGLKVNSNDRIKIASVYDAAILNSNCSKILYSIKLSDNNYEYHVYNIKWKKDQKVLSDVYEIYDYNDDFTEFIYGTLNKDVNVDLSNFVIDDKKEYDEKFKVYSFDDYWSSKIDYDTYKQSQKDASSVEKRNKIREELADKSKKDFQETQSVDVYYKKGKKVLNLASSVSKVKFTDLNNKRLVYSKNNYSSLEKMKISEIDSLEDVENYVKENLRNAVFYKYGESKEAEITSNKSLVKPLISGDDLYVLADGEMLYATLKKDKLGEVKSISKDVSYVDWENMYDGGLVFISNAKNESGDLNVLRDGKLVSVDTNVFIDDLVVEWNKIYYFKDYKNYSGNYYSFSGKPKRILSDASRVQFLKDNYMYVLKNYSSKDSSYDLYSYKNKKLELIDKSVDFIDID